MRNCIAVIPARAGSKGIPGKNSKVLGGKPLIMHTVDVARQVFNDAQIIVSTDSVEIRDIVEASGLPVPFLRPKELASDTASSRDVLLHAVEVVQNMGNPTAVVVLLQPTSPFRTAAHIEEALSMFSPNIDMVVSVRKSTANPYFNLFEEGADGYLHKSKASDFVRRQDCPAVYEFNGAIYVVNQTSLRAKPIGEFTRVTKYVMDDFASVDIDVEMDWIIAEYLMERRNNKPVKKDINQAD